MDESSKISHILNYLDHSFSYLFSEAIVKYWIQISNRLKMVEIYDILENVSLFNSFK